MRVTVNVTICTRKFHQNPQNGKELGLEFPSLSLSLSSPSLYLYLSIISLFISLSASLSLFLSIPISLSLPRTLQKVGVDKNFMQRIEFEAWDLTKKPDVRVCKKELTQALHFLFS